MEVGDRQGEGLPLHMIQLMIVALKLAAQRSGEALGGRAGEAFFPIDRSMHPVSDPAGAGRLGVRGHCLDPASGDIVLDQKVG